MASRPRQSRALAALMSSLLALASVYAARPSHWVAAAHLSFPGIGHLRGDGKGYAWVPANCAPAH